MVQENNRIRIKRNTLKKMEENNIVHCNDKEIKIEKGKLTIDGFVVDQNMLFP